MNSVHVSCNLSIGLSYSLFVAGEQIYSYQIKCLCMIVLANTSSPLILEDADLPTITSLRNPTLTKMYWLLGRKSKLSTSNKLLIYKTILKPIWTYGIQLWGTASTFNTEILERFLSKALRMIVDAPWYVPNTVIRRDLQIPTIKEEIRRYSSQYSARLSAHPNELIVNLIGLQDNRRLQRHLPNDLSTRFIMSLLYL
jgi:hypothetical protein